MRQTEKIAFRDGLRLWAAAMILFLAMMFGCSATKPTGWHPADKNEMKMLIGQTATEAIHLYQTQLWERGVQVPKAGSRMNKDVSPATELSPGQGGEDNRV